MRNLTVLFTFGSMFAGSLIGGDANASDYIKNAYGVRPIELSDPTWTRGITDPLWSVVDWEATDLVVLAPSYVDLPGDTFIIFQDGEFGLTVGELEVLGARDLLAQLDTMVGTEVRRFRGRRRLVPTPEEGKLVPTPEEHLVPTRKDWVPTPEPEEFVPTPKCEDGMKRVPGRVIRSIDRSIRSGLVTVILSDDLFYTVLEAAGIIVPNYRLESVFVINPDSMHPAGGWVGSNPTPHP